MKEYGRTVDSMDIFGYCCKNSLFMSSRKLKARTAAYDFSQIRRQQMSFSVRKLKELKENITYYIMHNSKHRFPYLRVLRTKGKK